MLEMSYRLVRGLIVRGDVRNSEWFVGAEFVVVDAAVGSWPPLNFAAIILAASNWSDAVVPTICKCQQRRVNGVRKPRFVNYNEHTFIFISILYKSVYYSPPLQPGSSCWVTEAFVMSSPMLKLSLHKQSSVSGVTFLVSQPSFSMADLKADKKCLGVSMASWVNIPVAVDLVFDSLHNNECCYTKLPSCLVACLRIHNPSTYSVLAQTIRSH